MPQKPCDTNRLANQSEVEYDTKKDGEGLETEGHDDMSIQFQKS